MRQLRISGHNVANGINARLRGAHEAIDLHKAALDLDLGLLNADVIGTRCATDRNQYLLRLDRLLLAVDGEGDAYTVFAFLDLVDFGVDESVDAALAINAHQLFRDLFVLDRHIARQHLQDGHVRAERLVDAGELNADRA